MRVLRFNIGSIFTESGQPHCRNVTGAPLNFQWEDTDHFPALEELSLPKPLRPAWPVDRWAYELRDNLVILAQVMNWTRMRRLDFHSNGLPLFFEIFTDRVPNIKHLRWGILYRTDVSGYGGNPTCASGFMASVTALDEVVFEAYYFDDFTRGRYN